MSAIDLYGLIGWLAALAMGLLYLAASTNRLPGSGTMVYLTLGVAAFAMVVLRFAEAF